MEALYIASFSASTDSDVYNELVKRSPRKEIAFSYWFGKNVRV